MLCTSESSSSTVFKRPDHRVSDLSAYHKLQSSDWSPMGPKKRAKHAPARKQQAKAAPRKRRKGILGAASGYNSESDDDYEPAKPKQTSSPAQVHAVFARGIPPPPGGLCCSLHVQSQVTSTSLPTCLMITTVCAAGQKTQGCSVLPKLV